MNYDAARAYVTSILHKVVIVTSNLAAGTGVTHLPKTVKQLEPGEFKRILEVCYAQLASKIGSLAILSGWIVSKPPSQSTDIYKTFEDAIRLPTLHRYHADGINPQVSRIQYLIW